MGPDKSCHLASHSYRCNTDSTFKLGQSFSATGDVTETESHLLSHPAFLDVNCLLSTREYLGLVMGCMCACVEVDSVFFPACCQNPLRQGFYPTHP